MFRWRLVHSLRNECNRFNHDRLNSLQNEKLINLCSTQTKFKNSDQWRFGRYKRDTLILYCTRSNA